MRVSFYLGLVGCMYRHPRVTVHFGARTHHRSLQTPSYYPLRYWVQIDTSLCNGENFTSISYWLFGSSHWRKNFKLISTKWDETHVLHSTVSHHPYLLIMLVNWGDIEAICIGCLYTNKRMINWSPKCQSKDSNNHYKYEVLTVIICWK